MLPADSYWLVMPAAGTGRRFGAGVPKQYARLAGRHLIEWSLGPFIADPRCRGIRVVIAPGDTWWPSLELEDPAGRLRSAVGGAERCHSVAAGLQELGAADDDWVLVHDAARPCLASPDLDRLLATRPHAPDGALLAAPLADTLKRSGEDARVDSTLPRERLWRAQTPQMFRAGLLRRALEHCFAGGLAPTDEAQAVEALGARPLLVEGHAGNIKVTTAGDLELAAALLGLREESAP